MVLNTANGYMLVDGFGRPYQYEKGGPTERQCRERHIRRLVLCPTQSGQGQGSDKVSNDITVKKDDKKTAVWIKNW